MGISIGRAALLVAFAASTLGCVTDPVFKVENDDFGLLKAEASQVMDLVEKAKKPGVDDPVSSERLRQLRSKESTLSETLAKMPLKAKDTQTLRTTLIAYKQGLAELVKAVKEDQLHFTLSEDPQKSAELDARLAQVEMSVSLIFKKNDDVVVPHKDVVVPDVAIQLLARIMIDIENARHSKDAPATKKERFDALLRTTFVVVDDVLAAIEDQWGKEIDAEVAKVIGDSATIDELRRRRKAVDAEIGKWLHGVDEGLKQVAASGTAPPGFLKADVLTKAIATAMGPDKGAKWDQSVGSELRMAIPIVEMLVLLANEFGSEPHDALVRVSAEISRIVAKYDALHKP